MQVLDYSAGFPGAQAIRAAGYAGAVRYIGYPGRLKCATYDELADFTAHDIGMALVHEDHADDWRGGFDGGVTAARRSRDHASAIGFPEDRPIYLAVDRDVVTEAEFQAAMAYLRGASSVLGVEQVGVYGEYDVCVRASAEGVARWFWQCRAWSGVPTPRLFPGRHLYQNVGYVYPGGVQSDFNDVLAEDWGQHNTAGDDMFTQEDRERLLGVQRALGRYEELYAAKYGQERRLGQAVFDIEQVIGAAWDEETGKGLGDLVKDIATRPVADVDEGVLAAALARRGLAGADPALVKEAFIEALVQSRVALEQDVAVEQAED